MASLKKRGRTYYAQYYLGGQQKRVSLGTDSLQIAKEKIRQIESALARGTDIPLPTRTPVAEVVAAYVEYLYTVKTPRNAQRDVFYLRETFGPICPALKLKNKKISERGKKRPCRNRPSLVQSYHFEQITTADIAQHIAAQVRAKGLAPKTANRFREVLTRLFNWAMQQNGIRMPDNANPAAKVERYKEKAQEITFLTLQQIAEQLKALEDYPGLQALVAVYIYAGLRREEALWLTLDDVDMEAGTYGLLRIRAKTVKGEYWQPKTKVNRVVPISRTLRQYLDRYQPDPVEGSWFFSSPKGKRWNPDNFSSTLREINAASRLNWSCLDFRHTFGSQLAMKGESLYKISNLMGNSPEICRKHYAAIIPESLTNSVEF
jgi:integrase